MQRTRCGMDVARLGIRPFLATHHRRLIASPPTARLLALRLRRTKLNIHASPRVVAPRLVLSHPKGPRSPTRAGSGGDAAMHLRSSHQHRHTKRPRARRRERPGQASRAKGLRSAARRRETRAGGPRFRGSPGGCASYGAGRDGA